MQPLVIKGIVHPKITHFCYLLTHMLSQTCIHLFLVLNTKEAILKYVGNQKVAGPQMTMEVTGDQQLFAYPHSSK